MAPHEWAFEELRRLLEERHGDDGADQFLEALARILKTYLGGRFRVDLLEKTTDEVLPALAPASLSPEVADGIRALLDACDRAKFARETAGREACRAAVDRAYGIVDATKPAPEVAA
jgi:hypothetical protein